MNSTVLITGSNGFIGPYLRDLLTHNGYTVHCTDHAAQGEGRYLQSDVTDGKSLAVLLDKIRPDYIIHLAGISFVPLADISRIYMVNVMGTVNLLEACISSGIAPRKILVPGSAHLYGNPLVPRITEETPASPLSHYAVSKLAMEHAARLYLDKLDIVIARPFNYTGPGQEVNFLIPKIVRHFRDKRDAIELGNLDVVRDFTDVRDVARAYLCLLEGGEAGAVYNICSGKGTSLMDVIAVMNGLAGYDIKVTVNPQFVRDGEIKSLIGDNTKLAALGWSPQHAFTETLRWMYDI